MLTRRFHFSGLFAVLLALMAQLGAGATVVRPDTVAGAAVRCHDDGGAPSQTPAHSGECLICPLCAPLHAQTAALLPAAPVLPTPSAIIIASREGPPSATGPPSQPRPTAQPRAPPELS